VYEFSGGNSEEDFRQHAEGFGGGTSGAEKRHRQTPQNFFCSCECGLH